ncbi:MAG: TlpA disulfide reductase family protein [Ferruginibacter sp.]
MTGFADGTRILINPYLDNMEVNRDDETELSLKNGEFEFSKHMDKPTKYSIRVRPVQMENLAEYEDLTFWAENTPMTLNGVKGQFFQSEINGSEIQDQYFENVKGISKFQDVVKQIIDSIKTMPNLPEGKKSEMRARFNSASNMIEKMKWGFVYANPQYFCTASELVFLITFFPDKLEKDELYHFYNEMPSALQSNVYGQQIKAFVTKNKAKIPELKHGDYPYNFSLNDITGNEVKFSSINSRVILLDFWGAGCAPCRMENKNYVKLYADYKRKGLEIVSVSVDQSKRMLAKAMKEDNVTWISLWDEKKEVYRDLYQVKALPTSYLIVDGKVMAIDLVGDSLRHEIEKILNMAKN